MVDYNNRKVPDYYPTMYLDGFTPEQIMYAAHKSMMKKIRPQIDDYEIHFTSEVKVKK